MFNTLLRLDEVGFYLVNRQFANPIFDFVMPLVTNLQNWLPLFFLAFVWLWRLDRKKTLKFLILLVVAVGIADFLNSSVLKSLFARTRPCVALPDARILIRQLHTFSFPSSHAVNSACAATIVSLVFPFCAVRVVSVLLVFLIGFSRLYIGVHYPLDVVCGYIEGVAIGYGVFYAAGLVAKGLFKRSAELPER